MVVVIVAIVVLLAYTLSMIKHIGKIPSSLFASVFQLDYSQKIIWTIVLYAVCFLCLPIYLDKTSENTQFLAFIAIAALTFVGAAPLVKNSKEMAYKVHCIAAVICATCSQLVLVFNYPILLLCWIPWICAFIWITKDVGRSWNTIIFWGEAVCFTSTFLYCLIQISCPLCNDNTKRVLFSLV